MTANWEVLGPEGLAFFGRICASVSHELKNALALINENAGLMQDLIAMAERGRPLDAETLAKASGRIGRHVGRANEVIANLNRFAHLADHPVQMIDLRAEAGLSVALHGRLASQRQVELSLAPGEEEISLRTRPFLLAEALHRCLVLALDNAAGKDVSVEVAGTPQGASVRFTGLAPGTTGPGAEASELLSALDARVSGEEGALTLFVDHTDGHNVATE